MAKKLFITGTGTDIGKTYVTGLILKKLQESGRRAAYYKAAMSGNERDEEGHLIPGDALHVKTVSGITQPLKPCAPMFMRRQYLLIWHPAWKEIRCRWMWSKKDSKKSAGHTTM